MKLRPITKNILASAFLSLLLPVLCFANSQVVMSIKESDPFSSNRSWYSFEEPAGGSATDTIVLRNTSNSEANVKIYAVDAFNNTAGSFVLSNTEDEQAGVGKWTVIEKNEVKIAPNDSREIDFVIKLPDNVAPGQYFGGIIKEEIPANECRQDECKGNIQIKTRTGNRIYLTVPGKLNDDIQLVKSSKRIRSGSEMEFTFEIENNGNVAFEPFAIISIRDAQGQEIEKIEQKIGKSLPGSTIKPSVSWNYSGKFGSYRAEAQILYQEVNFGRLNSLKKSPKYDEAKFDIFIIPWSLALPLILLLAISIFTIIFRQLKLKKLLKSAENYKVEANETLEEIASQKNMPWRLLAKINKLKAPYGLKPGQIIKIPKQK